MKYVVIVFAIASLMLGCVMDPRVGANTTKPTKMEVTFRDTTPEQDTEFTVSAESSAGVDLAQLTGFSYKILPDGSVLIGVNSDAMADTTRQAELLESFLNKSAEEQAAIYKAYFENRSELDPTMIQVIGMLLNRTPATP